MLCIMESGNSGRFSIKILIVGILISHEFINSCRGTDLQKGTQSSSAGRRSSDIISLLNKLAAVMEGMKTQIVCEVAMLMANQSKEIEKIANDIKNGQQLIMDQLKKTANSISVDLSDKVYYVEDCCARQKNKTDISQKLLINIRSILANFTVGLQISKILQKKSSEVHAARGAVRSQQFDPRLENFGNRWANASWTIHNAWRASVCPIDFNHQRAALQNGTLSSYTGKRSVVRESQSKGDTVSSYISLLNKLAAVMEGMKAQIDCEVTLLLAKQSKEIEKIANDIKNGQQLIMDQLKKTANSISVNLSDKVYYVEDCCTRQKNTINISQQLLIHIRRILANFTVQTSLTFQNSSDEGSFNNKTVTPPIPAYNDCSEIRRMGHSTGPYRIRLTNETIDVYCDFDTPGGDWLVFQRRKYGNASFLNNWLNYARGFGKVTLDFWLGNENLYQLTSKQKYKLRVDLEDFENQTRYAEYSSFSVGPSSDYYRLKIGNYSGNAGDSLKIHNNMQFSTDDADHDAWPDGSCASLHRGAWWYGKCLASNLNGIFYGGPQITYADGINWFDWRGLKYSLKSEMKMSL